ncbi:MAG: hypothetical protein HQK91_10100 [Nitrospirae bacterium]|nr:hypothetical protein [Nitrospirota bacterium]
MCVVIDINVFPHVFIEKLNEYTPLKKWITIGNGKLVYGGTKYINELRQMSKYRKFLIRLRKARRLVEVDCLKVDNQEKLLIDKNLNDFDDPHIIAIIIVSGCKLICTDDKRSYQYIKYKDIYPKNFELPKIYSPKTKKSHTNLSDKKYYADICKPASKIKVPFNL